MIVGKCPSCGADVEFGPGAFPVVVCARCQTVVGRADQAFKDYGKVATLVDTDSPVHLGLSGKFENRPFRVVGCLQKSQGQGVWDEWALEFDDGETAFLVEARGSWSLLFEGFGEPNLPTKPGQTFTFQQTSYTVDEMGEATVVAASGRFSSGFDARAPHRFIDASGPKTLSLSIEFEGANALSVWAGRTIVFEELGFADSDLKRSKRKVALHQARCPQCGGMLAFHRPDDTQRVGCPYCNSLIDVRKNGKLSFLLKLQPPENPPLIPLGAQGELFGTQYVCIAFLVRSCSVDGVRYPWEEYLLWNQKKGFRWLMRSEGHWTFLTPIPSGQVKTDGYRLFRTVRAKTEYILGECYWKVVSGEVTEASEYVSPPDSLNSEQSGKEVSWTRGLYVEPRVIQKAFHLSRLPRPKGIAPSQPNPHALSAGEALKWTAIFVVAILMVFLFKQSIAAEKVIFDDFAAVPATAGEKIVLSEPFDLPRRGNVRIDFFALVPDNSWAGAEVNLVSQSSDEVYTAWLEGSRYVGRDAYESWVEDERSKQEYFSSIPAGKYVVRVVPSGPSKDGSNGLFSVSSPPDATAPTLRIKLVSDTPRFFWAFCACLLVALGPFLQQWRSRNFEFRRWKESDYPMESVFFLGDE